MVPRVPILDARRRGVVNFMLRPPYPLGNYPRWRLVGSEIRCKTGMEMMLKGKEHLPTQEIEFSIIQSVD